MSLMAPPAPSVGQLGSLGVSDGGVLAVHPAWWAATRAFDGVGWMQLFGTACSHLCDGSVSRRRQCGWRGPLIREDGCYVSVLRKTIAMVVKGDMVGVQRLLGLRVAGLCVRVAQLSMRVRSPVCVAAPVAIQPDGFNMVGKSHPSVWMCACVRVLHDDGWWSMATWYSFSGSGGGLRRPLLATLGQRAQGAALGGAAGIRGRWRVHSSVWMGAYVGVLRNDGGGGRWMHGWLVQGYWRCWRRSCVCVLHSS